MSVYLLQCCLNKQQHYSCSSLRYGSTRAQSGEKEVLVYPFPFPPHFTPSARSPALPFA